MRNTETENTTNDVTPLIAETEDSGIQRTLKRRNFIIIAIVIITLIIVLVIFIVSVIDSKKDSSSTNWEQLFLNSPNAQKADENSKLLSSKPHVAASPENYEYAIDIQNELNELGYTTQLINYPNIYLSQYNGTSLSQLNASNPSQIIHEFDLSEAIISEDSSSNTTYRHEAWLGYSAKGNINGYVIYVNYGNYDDFDILMNELNFDLQNKSVIALVRYGGLLRGIKALNAAQYGFKAVILFSDPQDYGYIRGDVLPNGPWLPSSGYQRGSAAYINRCFGNPSPERSQNKCGRPYEEIIPSIPIIPLSYGNAYKLMSQMNGMMINENQLTQDWQGGMNLTYRIGSVNESDGVMVNLYSGTTYGPPTTITNVEGYIEGTKYKNESILFGAHRDAWVFGTADPISGTTSILEIARAFSTLVSRGWKPKRSIYFLSWDAEEFDLIGSTEYGENRQEWVQNELVAYINQDVAVSGEYFTIENDPLLEIFVKDCMRKVNYESDTIFDLWMNDRTNSRTGMLGSGSDYTVFVHEYGIAAINGGFTARGYGSYHSIYDSYYTMSKYMDPGYKRLKSAAQVFGLMGFIMVNEDILPFNTSNLYSRMLGFINLIDNLSQEYNCIINQSLKQMLINGIESYGQLAVLFDMRVEVLRDMDNGNDEYDELVRKYNYAMRTLGTKFIYNNGLPTRPIFKNLIVAAAVENGYGEQVFPYIAYTIKYECNNTNLYNSYNITATAMYDAAEYLESYL